MAGEKVVRRDRAAKGQFEMGVDIDAAGQHQHAAGVDHVCAVGGQIMPDLGDLLALDQHVGLLRSFGGDDRSVGNQCAHRFALLKNER